VAAAPRLVKMPGFTNACGARKQLVHMAPCNSSSMGSKPWRLSASVIVLAPYAEVPDCEYTDGALRGDFDYRLCCVKRGARSSFMPDTMVFPGGAVDVEDRANATEILHSDDLDSIVRCAAVREAFEESGVCIFEPRINMDAGKLSEWRKKVHERAGDLQTLCAEYEVCPAIRSLHYWCSFITPDLEHGRLAKGGFDARFFVWCAPPGTNMIQASADKQETVSLIWLTPLEALEQVQAKRITMAPPQWYIIRELADHCTKLSTVEAYAISAERALQRDYPIKPYPVGLSEEERENLLKEDKSSREGPPPPTMALTYPGDEAHPIYPGPAGARHRMLMAGAPGKLASFKLQRHGNIVLPLKEARQGWYTLGKL